MIDAIRKASVAFSVARCLHAVAALFTLVKCIHMKDGAVCTDGQG